MSGAAAISYRMAAFTKPSRTLQQQIADLQSKGMIVGDVLLATHWLQHVSYYRLSIYWREFENFPGTPGPRFRSDTHFETAASIYEFDRKLRLTLMDAIERLEVAIRGSWAYELAHNGGPHAYLDASHYSDRTLFHQNFAKLARDVGESKETFIRHYRENYDLPVMPPVWMAAEIMSLGQLSRWLSLLSSPAIRNAISNPFGLHESVLVPFVRHLSTVRNTCAHHGRLWNRKFLIGFKLPHQPSPLAQSLTPYAPGPVSIYNTLAMLVHLMKMANPGSSWKMRLVALLEAHPTDDLAAMGFPADWRSRPLWT